MNQILKENYSLKPLKSLGIAGVANFIECCEQVNVYDKNLVSKQAYKVLGISTSFSYVNCPKCGRKVLVPEK